MRLLTLPSEYRNKVARPKLSNIAVCRISIASLRRLPDHQSSLSSQVLFGECVEIISRKNKDWFRVRCTWDNHVGWIDPKQFYVLKEKEVNKVSDCSVFALEHLHGLHSDDYSIPISVGSNLMNSDGLNVKLPFGTFKYSGQIIDLARARYSSKLLIRIAKLYLHCPYLYGGRSILGLDASGFIQVIFKMVGIAVPRWPHEQAEIGEDIGFHSQSRAGDLAFFGSGEGVIDHVGLILEDNRIMHVFGQARIDIIDQQGIFDKQRKKYLFPLRTIRRISELLSGE